MAGGVAGAASLAFGAGAASAAAPRITLNPTQGTPATVVQVQGTGFCASPPCSQAQIVFQGVTVADGIVVAADGSFRASFQPAAGPPGWKTVTGQQKNANGIWITSAPATFYMTLAPPTPTPTAFPRTPTPIRSPSSSPSSSAQPSATAGSPAPTVTPSAAGPAAPGQGTPPASTTSWWPWPAVIAAAVLAFGSVVFLVSMYRRSSL